MEESRKKKVAEEKILRKEKEYCAKLKKEKELKKKEELKKLSKVSIELEKRIVYEHSNKDGVKAINKAKQ